MQYLLSEDEFRQAIMPKEAAELRRRLDYYNEAMAFMRETIVGDKCVHSPVRVSQYAYCDNCPLSDLSRFRKGRAIAEPDYETEDKLSRLMCPLTREYSK